MGSCNLMSSLFWLIPDQIPFILLSETKQIRCIICFRLGWKNCRVIVSVGLINGLVLNLAWRVALGFKVGEQVAVILHAFLRLESVEHRFLRYIRRVGLRVRLLNQVWLSLLLLVTISFHFNQLSENIISFGLSCPKEAVDGCGWLLAGGRGLAAIHLGDVVRFVGVPHGCAQARSS